jgi:hypothetical protein
MLPTLEMDPKRSAMEREPELHALLTLGYVLRHQQTANGEVFVELGPVDPDTATHETPIAKCGGAGVTEFGEPIEGHRDGPAVFEMDDEIAFYDLDAEGSWVLRCRNTHAISPGNRCDAE